MTSTKVRSFIPVLFPTGWRIGETSYCPGVDMIANVGCSGVKDYLGSDKVRGSNTHCLKEPTHAGFHTRRATYVG